MDLRPVFSTPPPKPPVSARNLNGTFVRLLVGYLTPQLIDRREATFTQSTHREYLNQRRNDRVHRYHVASDFPHCFQTDFRIA